MGSNHSVSAAVVSRVVRRSGSAVERDEATVYFWLDPYHLCLSALLIAGLQLLFGLGVACCRLRRLRHCAGGITFAATAATTFALSQQRQLRPMLLTSAVCLWAVRLAVYLCYRQIVLEDQHRDIVDKGSRNGSARPAARDGGQARERAWLRLLVFWTFQGLWAFIVSIPVILSNAPVVDHERVAGMGAEQRLSDLDVMGVVMWSVGFLLEFCADVQKFRFRRRPSNEDKFCDDGLWTWSRHPNYFGEMLAWWGVFVVFCNLIGEQTRWMWIGLCSPLLVSAAILFLSGMPPQEQSADLRYGHDEDYRDYKSSTSPLVPMPPELYVKFPRCMQVCCLFELPIYDFLDKKPKPTDNQPPKAARRFDMPY